MAWSVLVTGSSRGIGLGLVKYLLNRSDPPEIVIAACRNPYGAKELQELKLKNSNLHFLQLDVTKFDTFPDVAKKVESIVGQNGLNVFLNNAGMASGTKYNGFEKLKPEDYQLVYDKSVIGPIFLTKALLPLIEQAAAANKDKPEGIKRAVELNMNSLSGSQQLWSSIKSAMAWSILVTGSSRGIGLALVKYFLNHADPPKIVIATCRNPDGAKELQELKQKYNSLHLLQLDMTKFDTFPDVAKKVESIVGQNGLNVLLNNAGVNAGNKYDGFGNLKPEDYQYVYNTNTIGPIFLTKELLPLIERAAAANKDKPEGIKRAAILNMSSLLGSVSMNTIGMFHAYRESKAALDQFSRSLAAEIESKGVVVNVLHPGHVRTELGGPEGAIGVDECVSGLINVLYSLDKSKHNKFFQWDGKELEW